ncbi:mastermind-like domain-containing protein 1 isoform X2 [Mesoplodon densirostris]|uniref:mastermind-like domain-containing protein 1 isoform X2 n=1 Tax=Mesoplodon densirostris TaxID=48708 RepID=UPI0028DCA52E|nr:mastermind-like domain-containing protein 1 isoform X2 [Mesoplodon densirostris]
MDDWKSRLVIKSMLPHFAMVGNRQEPRKLQESGTIKRRQEEETFQLSGMAEGGYPNKIKRPCLEDVTLSMGPGAHPSTACAELQVPALPMNPSPAAMGAAGHSLLLENNPMNGSVMGSPFGVPPTAEMGLKGPPLSYYDKTNTVPAVDQELQDLLEELTKIQEPSPSELDLEKILGSKPEEPLVLDHPPATLGVTPKPAVQMPHLESLGSSKDFASSCSQAPGVSLQIPPSSAGISYVIPSTSKQMVSPSSSTAQAKSQVQAPLPAAALPPLPVPQWHHAHQLKALAASKQGSSTKQQGPAPSWSGLPLPGLSPPYRPLPSPQPLQPFSPQGLMVSCMSSSSLPASALQGSPNALLSSAAPSSGAALGPAMTYAPEKLPSPALQQQPQFSPQPSILANLVSSTIKQPQGHLISTLPTSNPGPSTPYRPEKLSSPGLPQQSFTPQCPLIRSLTPTSNPLGPQQPQLQLPPPPPPPASAILKPMATSSPRTLSLIMQQGLAAPSPGAPEPFTFGHTKPLSHFVSEPGPPKMPSVPAASRQPALLHYLQQPTLTPASSATASSTATTSLQLQQQPDAASFLLQHVTQQPQRVQRSVASDSMPSLPRQACCQLFSWTSAAGLGECQHPHWSPYPSRQDPQPGAVSPSNTDYTGPRSACSHSAPLEWVAAAPFPTAAETELPTPSGHLLLLQEKQKSGLMAMTPEQRSAYLAQQMSQFQAVQDQVTSKCSRTKASSPPSQPMMPPGAALLQSSLSPGMVPPARHQSREGVGLISPTPGKQQGIFSSSPQFPTPLRLSHNPAGSLGSTCRRTRIPKAAPTGVPLPGFCPSPLGSQPLSPHQLRQPCVPRVPTVLHNAAWVAAAAAVSTAVLRGPPPRQAAHGIQQHFHSNSLFAKAPVRVPPGAPAFPSQQAVVSPSQVAPGGRPGQKVGAAPANPNFGLLGHQSLRQSPLRGPVPVLHATKSLQQGMASFRPMSPIQGIEPPSYVAATAAAAAASTIAASPSPGPFNSMGSPPELPPYALLPQASLNDLISPPDCTEVDFIEALLKGPGVSPDEDWVCNLRLIDDILEQHAAAQTAAAQSAGHVPEQAGHIPQNVGEL